MSTASNPLTTSADIVKETQRACELARRAAHAAAAGLHQNSPQELDSVRDCEKELDSLDHDIDERVTNLVTQVPEAEARELLACMKLMIGLERIGDLLVGFAQRARAVGSRLEAQDIADMTSMASFVERMLGEVNTAYRERDARRAVGVLRMDAELDRMRNLMFVRHIENPEGARRQQSFHVIFMAQALERAGDHAKNLAEEICYLVSGHTVRHVMRSFDKPFENMFLEWMRQKAR